MIVEKKEKYTKVFQDAFNISKEKAIKLKYQSIKGWDSVGHMQLMSALEDEFEIELDTDDIIDFSSYSKGIEILKKYKVDIK